MPEPDGGTKAYLEYLDKEMSIMGILSTFCVAAASLAIDRTAGAEKTSFLAATIWARHMGTVCFGCALLMAAGLFFYLQRSHLAHLYGSMCMSVARPGGHQWNTDRWLEEAYSWATWLHYRTGFMFLTLTAVIGLELVHRKIQEDASWWPVSCFFGLVVLAFVRKNVILTTYRYEDDAFRAFSLKTFRDDWRDREKTKEERRA